MTHSRMAVQAFHDPATATVSYVVADRTTRRAAVIDPVLDYDFRSGTTRTESAARLLSHLDAEGLALDWILETHVHADHLSAASWLKQRVGGRIAIGEHIRDVQRLFGPVFDPDGEAALDGRPFDRLLADGEVLRVGGLEVRVLHVPGHTPADVAYVVEGAAFVGDTLFMPDVGTARADFPGGDARTLYRSIRRLLALPPETAIHVCHDYPPSGREPRWCTTVAEQRAHNIHVHDGVDEDAFVALREARDATLELPTLMLPSIQVNVRAGALPAPQSNGVRYLKIPLDTLARVGRGAVRSS